MGCNHSSTSYLYVAVYNWKRAVIDSICDSSVTDDHILTKR